MFERFKRFVRKLTTAPDEAPDSFDIDCPRPQRANPDPPKNDWFARVRAKSLRAAAVRETKALDALDEMDPALSREAAREVDALLARARDGANA